MESTATMKIMSMQSSFTPTENEIGQHVIKKNRDFMMTCTISDIAEKVGTSEASVNYFAAEEFAYKLETTSFLVKTHFDTTDIHLTIPNLTQDDLVMVMALPYKIVIFSFLLQKQRVATLPL